VSSDSQRTAPDPWDIGFGAVTLVGAVLALGLWFPNDIAGAFIEYSPAGKAQPGDAFFPILLASALLVLSVVQLLGAFRSRTERLSLDSGAALTLANLEFLLKFFAIVLTGLAVMYWLGPLTTGALRALGVIDQTYRQLVDTVPYKYLGYVTGGFLMICGMITWAEGQVTRRAVLTVAIVLAASVVIFDLLLSNIQLPPNADY